MQQPMKTTSWGLRPRFGHLPKVSLPHRLRLQTAHRFKPNGSEENLSDYYAILEISPASTADQIKAGYRRMQKRCHPDISGEQNLSALINEAYTTLSDPNLKDNYDHGLSQYRVKHKGELSRIPYQGPGVLGPIQPGDVLAMELVKVKESSDFDKEGRKLLVWIREWAKTFMFASELPLPMPVQCDDIEAGVRLAVIAKIHNVIQSVGELVFTISPTVGLDAWAVEVKRVNIVRPGPIAGEDRLMQAFTDAMRDRSTPDKKKKGAMFELSGMAAAAFAQLMPALVPLPIGRQPDGAAYEAYHLKHDEDIIE